MPSVNVHVSAADLRLSGSYERVGDVLYLSSAQDDKHAPVQETPEGHAVRISTSGEVTHLTVVNARWLLERDGEITASLRDGRRLRLDADELASLVHDAPG